MADTIDILRFNTTPPVILLICLSLGMILLPFLLAGINFSIVVLLDRRYQSQRIKRRKKLAEND